MIRIFRFILILLSLASALLSVFAFIGSYKTEEYLTRIYLINVHLTNLDLSKLLDLNLFSKRGEIAEVPLSLIEKRAPASSAPGIASSVSSTVSGLTYNDLGLAEVYSVSLWGYCKGKVDGKLKSVQGFDNSNVDYYYCSKPVPGYFFDPLTIFKQDLKSKADKLSDGSELKSELDDIFNKVTYENLNLPGDLHSQIQLLNNLTKASFAFILMTAVFSVIFSIYQLVTCFFSHNTTGCLSCLNFFFEATVFITSIIGAGIVTGTYVYVRKTINGKISEFGVKSFLSVAFYALIWCAVIANILIIVTTLIGHCCGGSRNNKRYKSIDVESPPYMGYRHNEAEPILYYKY